MKRWYRLAMVGLCAAAAWAQDDTQPTLLERARASYDRALVQFQAEHDASARRLATAYGRALRELEASVRSQGELADVLAVRREMERLETGDDATDVVPVERPLELSRLQKQFLKAVAEAGETAGQRRAELLVKYVRYLEEQQRKLTIKGAFDEALAIKDELDLVKVALPVPDPEPEEAAPQVPDGLVLHYDFEGEGERVVDRTGQTGDAVLHGGTREADRGGLCLRLDGEDDYMDTPLTFPAGPMSVALWVRRADLTGRYCYILGAHNPEGHRFYMGLSAPDGELGIGVGDLGMQKEGFGLLRDREWHHCAMTRGSERTLLYVDGIKVAARSQLPAPEGAFLFGTASHFYSGAERPVRFAGCLDDIMFFGRALSAEEIETLFLATGGDPKGQDATKARLLDRVPRDAAAFGDHHYKVFREPCAWPLAMIRCENMGGHLVTIESEDENRFVTSLSRRGRTWLGASDLGSAGTWRWVNGGRVVFAKWAKPVLSSHRGGRCLTLSKKGQWGDELVASENVTAYVCEWE